MNGPIAQIVALTCSANASIQGHGAGGLFLHNSTCAFCDRVSFVSLQRSFLLKAREKEVAKTPDEWFAFLASHGAKGVRLSRTPQSDPIVSDRMSAGFVHGGGTWALEVVLPKDRSDYWIARWNVWDQDAPDQRIWRVTYARVSSGASTGCGTPDLDEVRARLTQALRDVHSFSTKHDCGGFTQCFADALDTLDSEGQNLHGYHKDLAPDGVISQAAHAVLDACQKSSVFGGMGSWNDMGFDGEEGKEYERVSERLFEAVNHAISAGANSSYRERVQGAGDDASGRAR